MKQTKKKIVWLVTFLGVGSIQAFGKPFAVGPYLGQTPPGPIAKVFAPGLICRAGPNKGEGHVSFSADGNTFCFKRLGLVYITENTDQGWTVPKRIHNIPYMPWSPCLSADANSIYFRDQNFTRSRRASGKWTVTYDPFKRKIYYRCMRTSRGWSLPNELSQPFNSASGGFSVTADNSICFKSRQGGFWIAPFVGNTWSQARKLHLEMGNLKGCHPGIAPDGSFLVDQTAAYGPWN
jgi:hypothetical protein